VNVVKRRKSNQVCSSRNPSAWLHFAFVAWTERRTFSREEKRAIDREKEKRRVAQADVRAASRRRSPKKNKDGAFRQSYPRCL